MVAAGDAGNSEIEVVDLDEVGGYDGRGRGAGAGAEAAAAANADAERDDDLEPTRLSLVEPGPLSIAGLSLAVVSFLSFVPLDTAFDAGLDHTTPPNVYAAALAKRESLGHLAVALVALLICAASAYLDDETDSAWARHLARAGGIVAAASLALHGAALGIAFDN